MVLIRREDIKHGDEDHIKDDNDDHRDSRGGGVYDLDDGKTVKLCGNESHSGLGHCLCKYLVLDGNAPEGHLRVEHIKTI